MDKYIYGHPNHRVFTSIDQFIPHFGYLMFHKDGSVCHCDLCEKGEKRGAKKASAGEAGGVQPRAPAAEGPNEEEDRGEEELWQGRSLPRWRPGKGIQPEVATMKRALPNFKARHRERGWWSRFRPPNKQICQRFFNQIINSSFNQLFRSQSLSVMTDCSISLYWIYHSPW